MKNGFIGFGAVICLVISSGCASTGGEELRRDFEVFVQDDTLDAIEFDADVVAPIDLTVERERVGARFAWGSNASRGYFQVFSEEWSGENSSTTVFDAIGIGGGAMGSPILGDDSGDVVFLLPWRVDLSLAGGEESEDSPADLALVYAELHADLGFGIEWKGLRPSAGFGISSISGVIATDDDLVEDTDLSGVNSGFFVDVKYKHEEYAVYGHFRAQAGDYESTILGVGFRF